MRKYILFCTVIKKSLFPCPYDNIQQTPMSVNRRLGVDDTPIKQSPRRHW